MNNPHHSTIRLIALLAAFLLQSIAGQDGNKAAAQNTGDHTTRIRHAASSKLLRRDQQTGGNICPRKRGLLRDGIDAYWNARIGAPGLDNANISALTVRDGLLYAGGDFRAIGGIKTPCIAVWDGNDWKPLGTGLRGPVTSIIADEKDLFAAGAFYYVGRGVGRGLARWNGSDWQPLGSGQPGVNGSVNAMALLGDELYAGGRFSEAGGVNAMNIAVWNRTSGVWSSPGAVANTEGTAVVTAVAALDSVLFVAGSFNRVGGAHIANVAAWHPKERVWTPVSAPAGPNPEGAVSAMTVHQGRIVICGDISIGGTQTCAAEWDPEDSTWTALGSTPKGTAYAVYSYSARLLLALPAETAETDVWTLWEWDGSQWYTVVNRAQGAVFAVAIADIAELVLGGEFTSIEGRPLRYLARLAGRTWTDIGGPPRGGVSSAVNAISQTADEVYFGGVFSSADGLPARNIARWDKRNGSWSALGADTANGVGGEVSCLLSSDDDLFVGGFFFRAGDVKAANIAVRNGNTGKWTPLQTQPPYGPDGAVHGLAFDGETLYVGGAFTHVDTLEVLGIAAWDRRTGVWHPVDAGLKNTYSDVVVDAVACAGGNLYIAGYFQPFAGNGGYAVARMKDGVWYMVTPEIEWAVHTLHASGDDLYIGGEFTSIGGVDASNIVRWDAKRMLFSALGEGVDGPVFSIASDGERVFAGGAFANAGGVPASNIARWKDGRWTAPGSGADGPVGALSLSDMNLFAGGAFTQAGGKESVNAAAWDDSILPVDGIPPAPGDFIFNISPNPAADAARLHVSALAEEHIAVTLHDALGRRLSSLFDGPVGPDMRTIHVDVSTLSAGAYRIAVHRRSQVVSLPLLVD